MKSIIFNVIIDMCGEIEIEIEVSEKEYRLLKQYSNAYYYPDDEQCEEFEECEKLSKLYKRIVEAAYDEMANSAYDDDSLIDEYCDGEYEFEKMRAAIVENYDIFINWPEFDDENDD